LYVDINNYAHTHLLTPRFTHMFVVTFENKAALDYYQDHELHTQVKNDSSAIVVKLLCMDILMA
jgi:glutaredoxin 2